MPGPGTGPRAGGWETGLNFQPQRMNAVGAEINHWRMSCANWLWHQVMQCLLWHLYLPISSEFVPWEPTLASNNNGGHLWTMEHKHSGALRYRRSSAVHRCLVVRTNNNTQTKKQNRRKPQFKKLVLCTGSATTPTQSITWYASSTQHMSSTPARWLNAGPLHRPAVGYTTNASWEVRSNLKLWCKSRVSSVGIYCCKGMFVAYVFPIISAV